MKILTGIVAKRSGDKTISVAVTQGRKHPRYAKTVSRLKKYLVHDPQNAATVGSEVSIRETRPLSKRKRWIVVYDS